MKLFGRPLSRYALGLLGMPSFIKAVLRAIRLFQNPGAVVAGYVTQSHRGIVRLRNGKVIHLSDDPRDIITVFLVFCRLDYGEIAPGSRVVDIGANIGVFSLFAAFSGAAKVLAFEPCLSSFEILKKNIKENELENIVSARNAAVTGEACDFVKFPKKSNVLNAILPVAYEGDDFDQIQAVDFHQIIMEMKPVDLLKMDCEGGEYDIFSGGKPEDFREVSEIRMEYHNGHEVLERRLAGMGFTVSLHEPNSNEEGNLWLLSVSAN